MSLVIVTGALAAVLGVVIGLVAYFAARSQGEVVTHNRLMKEIVQTAGLPGLAIAGGLMAFVAWWIILYQFLGPRG